MSDTVTVNSDYKIEIPKPVREALNLNPGDQLSIELEGIKVVLQRKPGGYANHLRGLHKEVWEGVWESGNNSGVTSVLTLLEILVKPKRMGNHQAAKDYREVILSYPHLKVLDINSAIAELASDLRAKYNVKAPDAIQLSTALVAGATGFVTNYGFLKRVTEIEVLILDEIEMP